ncbi:transcriptional regulator [Flagellimonas aquimarina]|jgi:Rrf2 family iron-sulfur cluster assembly transcriptional regulator|uniref:Transcriptional regulator n=1 Tax=Flagellimonas aquimarina TaxID=2201895 RepID=A0A316KT13_9FLAO|nr:Rrf2 family transcriptional regulator [Allomuricauda koreensis]PWL37362.1 transcriptional regulator [Allomuricauda koreensis]
MISNSSKYAVKAVLYLALNSSESHKILAKDISSPTNIPKAYLAKVLQELSRHNIVSSVKGPGGGFYLSEDNKKIPIMKIIHVIDGDNRLTSCMLSLQECDEENPCPMHDLVGNTKVNFVKNLEQNTVEDLVEDIREGKSFLPL